jgi:hypothetical protein
MFQTLQKLQLTLPVWITIRAGIATVSKQNHNRPTITSHSLSAKIDSAYDAQTKIGWHNFLKGRISTQWGDIMQDHYDKFHFSNCTHSRERFQTTLITGLWKMYDSVWKLRSALLHDPRDLSSLSNIELNKCIRRYYSQPRYFFSAIDQHLLATDLDIVLRRSTTQKCCWLQVLDDRASLHSETHDDIMRHVPSLYSFFNT